MATNDGVNARVIIRISKAAQGKCLGKLCLLRAIEQVTRAASEIGLYALVLDAKDEQARSWYEHTAFGFEPLLDDPNHLYLSIETIRQALKAADQSAKK